MGLSRKIALGFAALLGVSACVFLAAVLVGQGASSASLWAAVLGLPVGLVAAGAAVAAVMIAQRSPTPLDLQVPESLRDNSLETSQVVSPPMLPVPEWAVDRPSEVSQVVEALLGGKAGTVGITTALHGVGGFGKTTLALMVCADERIQRQFDGGEYLVTVGGDVRDPPAVAAKVNDLIKLVSGKPATFTDPELAGQWLGALLDVGRRRLLVIDDVWEQGQLAPFTIGGRQCARLVTTRVPGLLAGRGVAVRVDQMSPEQARQVLTSGLAPLDRQIVRELLAVTGRWPLLLGLVNKILYDAAGVGADVSVAGVRLLERLRQSGPTVVDDVAGTAEQGLDVAVPAERTRAVRATIAASTSLLAPDDADRFAELAYFAEDERIPFRLAALFWRTSVGLDDLQASQVAARLARLALVSTVDNGGLQLHDVILDFLRSELGPRGLARLDGVLPAYWATVRAVHNRTPTLLGREDELAELAHFATSTESYRWLRGGAFVGKTALVAEAVTTTLPSSVDVVSYFLSRSAADADSNRFLAAVVPQLAHLLGKTHLSLAWMSSLRCGEAPLSRLRAKVDTCFW